MPPLVIETRNIDFAFNKESLTIRSLNMQVQKGAIYGFLGANGSGKTTSIRLILGLLPPLNGSAFLFGNELKGTIPKVFSRIGTLVETPSLYDHLSAYDNLKIVARIKNLPQTSILESLSLVGLSKATHKHAGKFSLGMKQRLGLAIALMSEPELLILDEPSNGLDPSGILEIRELLQQLNKERGITILISSHLLPEIEKLVSHVGIINNGSLIFQDTISALHLLQQPVLHIRTNREDIQMKYESDQQVSSIARKLIESGVDVYDLHVSKSTLENIFLSITDKGQ